MQPLAELITLLQSRSEGFKDLEMNFLVRSSNISNRIHVIGFIVHQNIMIVLFALNSCIGDNREIKGIS